MIVFVKCDPFSLFRLQRTANSLHDSKLRGKIYPLFPAVLFRFLVYMDSVNNNNSNYINNNHNNNNNDNNNSNEFI